jgi:uncharacterized protein
MQNELELRYNIGKEKNREIIYLIIFTILFFTMQSFYAYIYEVNPFLRYHYVIQIIIRLLTWTLPVLIYLIVQKKNPFDYLKVRKNILKGFLWGIILSIIWVIYNITGFYLMNRHVRFDLNISNELWWKAIILVGFSEEVLFRGFLLQKIEGISKFWIANIINAILFVLVHLVGWIITKQIVFPNVLITICNILFIGLIQGLILKKTNSLWACILLHSCNNFLSFALV